MKASTSRTPPAPLEAHLGFWLRFVSNHVSLRFQQLLETQDVTLTEWVALRTLWSQDGTTHAELIQALGMTKGATSKVVSRLEEKALAERQRVLGRAREQSLVLTAAGKDLVPRLAALADANDEHFFSHLPAKDRQTLMTSLQALVQQHQLQAVPIS
ncbi:MAG: MarR family winged helix-turn-helix transcriptional regulator [Hydrogenophaga sp.]|jgi:DNA-binding MarR family transcriptional regulator|uniref:MarR family winged helix-turn-helix transcriptional regulator n=1 Tax=Hydrogenophaga sp. TaxID=1904254 RepID=UPI001D820117|nr:MarR family winged helix-turn-helix transcriptional regulator [Hydrogenophaga sp.]MBW0171723.1 MarR family winged helix-turn-helix transcriptional regulator [Hydrogenophaga sp.]MBW0184023.1 MarR family winged helix-turn-helix transcriptional regulator [Hydrogenophaga sp.]